MICFEQTFILHFAAFLIYFSLAVYVASGKISSTQRLRLFLIAVCFAVGSIERLVSHNSCTTMELVKMLQSTARFAWIAATPLCFLLLLGLTKNWKTADSFWLNSIIAAYVIISYNIDLAGFGYTIMKAPYGWFIHNNGKYSFLYNYGDLFFTYAALIAGLYAVFLKKDDLSKRQAVIIVIFGAMAVAAQLLTQAFMPGGFLGDSADILNIILVLGAALAINRYGFISLNSAFVSEELFKSIPEMMAVIDMEGNIMESNGSYKKKSVLMSGTNDAGNIAVLFSGGRDAINEIIENIRIAGKVEALELAFAGGGVGIVTATKLSVGNTAVGIACVITDITAIKKMQDEIQVNYDRLVVLDTMKTTLTHSLTHDLRNPMVSIKGFVALLLKGAAEPLNEKQTEMLSIIERNVARQLKLISEMLEVAKLESAGVKLEKRRFDLVQAADDCLEEIAGAAAEKNITFNFVKSTLPVMICADEFKIWQVLENLVGNAVKFSPENKTLLVSVSAVAAGEMPFKERVKNVELKSGRLALFTVKNEGTGVAREDLERIFERFEQGTDKAANAKGNGLGLFIAKSIITAHGGWLWAESKGAEEGVTFIFALPAEP